MPLSGYPHRSGPGEPFNARAIKLGEKVSGGVASNFFERAKKIASVLKSSLTYPFRAAS
jgi:hypothetical protein